MTEESRLARVLAFAAISVILSSGFTVPSYPQSADVRSGHNQQVKPAKSTKPTVSPQPKPWSLDDALPDNSPASRARTSDSSPNGNSSLGRVPLKSGAGSIGFETETKVKSTEFPDGRRTPGVETTTQHPPSYLGLSISVPTPDKSMIPALVPPFGKSE
jgi:hypothetical protein